MGRVERVTRMEIRNNKIREELEVPTANATNFSAKLIEMVRALGENEPSGNADKIYTGSKRTGKMEIKPIEVKEYNSSGGDKEKKS